MDSGNEWGVQYNNEAIFGEKKRRGQSIPAA